MTSLRTHASRIAAALVNDLPRDELGASRATEELIEYTVREESSKVRNGRWRDMVLFSRNSSNARGYYRSTILPIMKEHGVSSQQFSQILKESILALWGYRNTLGNIGQGDES